MQPSTTLPDASERLVSLIPQAKLHSTLEPSGSPSSKSLICKCIAHVKSRGFKSHALSPSYLGDSVVLHVVSARCAEPWRQSQLQFPRSEAWRVQPLFGLRLKLCTNKSDSIEMLQLLSLRFRPKSFGATRGVLLTSGMQF